MTTGMDAQMRVWDCRQFRPLHSFYSRKPAASLSISQRGLLALGYGKVCEVWIKMADNTGSTELPTISQNSTSHTATGCRKRSGSCAPNGNGLGVT